MLRNGKFGDGTDFVHSFDYLISDRYIWCGLWSVYARVWPLRLTRNLDIICLGCQSHCRVLVQ